jgi:hypothetical protein
VPVPEPQDNLRPAPKAARTVILGTWGWNIATNKLGKWASSDLHWAHQTATERFLEPLNGAAIKVVAEPFEKIDLHYLKNVEFAKGKVSGSDNNNLLKRGTVLAVRTGDGSFAKLRVTRYYKLHDFSFPGAEVLNEAWKQGALRDPDRDHYHIEVEWIRYQNEGR